MSPAHSGLLLAVLSALLFAFASAVQHRAAEHVAAQHPTALLRRLVRHRGWLAGVGLAVLAWVLHAVALGMASVAAVQALSLAGVAVGVVARDLLDRRRTPAATLVPVALTLLAVGVLVLAMTTPHRPSTVPLPSATVLFIVLLALTVLAYWTRHTRTRTSPSTGPRW